MHPSNCHNANIYLFNWIVRNDCQRFVLCEKLDWKLAGKKLSMAVIAQTKMHLIITKKS